MPESAPTPPASHRTVPVRDLAADALLALSKERKLSLSTDDMLSVQAHFRKIGRDPTDVELEVIAQTWSEHCKHRIFGAKIEHTLDGRAMTVDGIFKTCIKKVSEDIFAAKPGFVLSAFHDNAGFIKLNDDLAICLKVETHNHPSAIEPYAGANTGLGGVIRDILGAGKGAKPVGSVDVFCFGLPDMPSDQVKPGTIHPLGILRGVVRGVRDYGNRMGIPTVAGAIHFHPDYTYNPLVFCGTAGVIPSKDIPKAVGKGMKIVAVGGRTGRDGLRGATFSSASLDTDSHTEDVGAVQIGNPIEEKKIADFIEHARHEGLIEFVTDCGAGGFSSAAGEMISEMGGEIYLERAPLKEQGLSSWEIFLSESQERMVLAVLPEKVARVIELAKVYDTEATDLGDVSGSEVLRVYHHGRLVCELDAGFLHQAPRKAFRSEHRSRKPSTEPIGDPREAGADLRRILSAFNLCSREPIIREYDHEVQGNTVGKPLAGPGGDCPQDGSVIAIPGTGKFMAVGVSLLPHYGELDPARMGLSCMDECMRQMVVAGADPDRAGLLDNFCMGNPDEPAELGQLVETARALATAAKGFGAPFISGKDSFYNYFQTDDGPKSIPMTVLISGIAIVDDARHLTGATIRGAGRLIGLLGRTLDETGASAHAAAHGVEGGEVPGLDPAAALELYRRFHQALKNGWILSAHDCSEGGLAIALAEAGFGLQAGVEVDLESVPAPAGLPPTALLFSESNARIVFEADPRHEKDLRSLFAGLPFAFIGRTVADHRRLRIGLGDAVFVDEPLNELKDLWKNGLTHYY